MLRVSDAEKAGAAHGSLFSGSGGFDLAARMAGIRTAWESEIEPFPLRVLRKNFPGVPQLGDVRNIRGWGVEPVDVVSGGSPCQDLSVAGKREGLDGGRSSLFFQFARIVREMRWATGGRMPRYMVWENVPGVFGSRGGDDFRRVLEEVCGIAEPGVRVPEPPKGRWKPSGEVVGDGYSVAWRIMDARYWGVPQRRKRVYLVADFGGQSAARILFEPRVLPWDPREVGEEGKAAPGRPEGGPGGPGRPTACPWGNGSGGRRGSSPLAGTGGDISKPDAEREPARAYCLQGSMIGRSDKNGPQGCGVNEEESFTLNATDRHAVVYSTSRTSYHTRASLGEAASLLATDYKDPPTVWMEGWDERGLKARRLTTLECCRLQGFPDWWCDGLAEADPSEEEMEFWRRVFSERGGARSGKTDGQIARWLAEPHSRPAEYKMWGNGVALPCAAYVMQGVANEIARDAMQEASNASFSPARSGGVTE